MKWTHLPVDGGLYAQDPDLLDKFEYIFRKIDEEESRRREEEERKRKNEEAKNRRSTSGRGRRR